MTNFIKAMTIAAAAAVTLPAVASAGTISISKTYGSIFGDPALYSKVQIGGDSVAALGTVNSDGIPQLGTRAGGFHVTTSASESFVAWCIDLAEYLSLPSDNYNTVSSPFAAGATEKLSQLFTGFVEDIDTGVEAAAFQVSIWEIISDTMIDLDAGDFRLLSNAAVNSKANEYLAGLSNFEADYDLRFFAANGSQDLITGAPSPVPLPASSLLLLAGIGALGMRARKRR